MVYEYLYRQIDDKKVKETIDFLLNREEAHNAMFREAFNRVQDTGSNQDFGTTKAAKMYFSMSSPKHKQKRAFYRGKSLHVLIAVNNMEAIGCIGMRANY